jgi:hypothetical protein
MWKDRLTPWLNGFLLGLAVPLAGVTLGNIVLLVI